MRAIILILAILLSSCSWWHGVVGDAGKIDLQNYDASKQLAKDFLKTWPLNSGFLRGALGEKLQEFPAGVVGAMDQLDRLAMKQEFTDFELGFSLGARVRMLGAIVQEALKLYSPEVLKFVPSLLSL